MTQSFVSELAQRLGKSEEEVVRFLQALWQLVPPTPEVQPFFVRYLDERFLRLQDRISWEAQQAAERDEALKERMEQLRQQMEQGFKEAAERDEALRQQMEQLFETLRQRMEEGFKEAAERDEALRQEFQREIKGLRQEIASLREEFRSDLQREVKRLEEQIGRLEKWLFALTVPVLVSMLGILGLLSQAFLFKPA